MIKKILALLFAMLLAAAPFQALADGGVQLRLESGAGGSWERLENDRMKARFTVTNASADKTVKSFEMHVYAADARGKCIWGDGTYYYWTTQKEILPGQSASSDYVTLPDSEQVAQLYAVIKKVAYTDGTVEETAEEELNYRHWNIEW